MKPSSEGGDAALSPAAAKDLLELPAPSRSVRRRVPLGARIRLVLGISGLLAAGVVFLWLPLGWLGFVPSLIEVFGMQGLRIPAGVTVGGLLLAAIGFNDF